MIIRKRTYREQFNSAVINIYYLIQRGCRFKIGKTHKTAAERLKDADYQSQGYTQCYGLFYSKSKVLVNYVESLLIDHFINNEFCKNEKDGCHSINDQMGESDEYCVYVAFKH